MQRVTVSCLVLMFATVALTTGCVRRTILITSDPGGALVHVNDVEVGRTPVEIDFTYYGRYDVRLVREGFEPLVTSGRARAPWWDTIGLDLIAEAVPGEPHSRIHWHYALDELPQVEDPQDVTDRARQLRDRLRSETDQP